MLKTPIHYALRTLSTLFPPQKPLVFSGTGSTLKLADLMVASGHRRPLLVTGGFLLENGTLDPLFGRLKDAGCEPTVFDGIVPNPTFDVVEAGLEACSKGHCDSVFVVGGGSAIDAAKVIAASAATSKPGGPQKLVGILKVKSILPFYVVPTTSGTGSEVTTAAVISDSTTHKKQFVVDPKLIPIGAALDPGLLKSLPPGMTSTTGMDALTHAIEAYTSTNAFKDTSRDAALAIRLLVEHLPAAYRNGTDERAREMVAIASFLAGFAFTKASLGYVHAISHQISGHYDTPHGLANAVLLPRVLRFNRHACERQFAELEAMLAGESQGREPERAERFIERIDRLSEELEIQASLPELKQEHFREIANQARAEARRTYGVPRVMSRADAITILESVASGSASPSFG